MSQTEHLVSQQREGWLLARSHDHAVDEWVRHPDIAGLLVLHCQRCSAAAVLTREGHLVLSPTLRQACSGVPTDAQGPT